MFAALVTRYVLRGWKHVTGVLIDLGTGNPINVHKNGFSLLMLCDGETDLDAVSLTAEDKALLTEYVDSGYIRLLYEPDPIQEFQRYRRYGNNLMESVMWSVTGRCNCRCRHCYVDAPDALLGELSTEQCFSIIDQMADCGIPRVELTGGEPLVRDDFWQIVDRLIKKHILITQIYTNGLLLTEKTLDAFEQRGLKPQIRFSFDGIGWHDWMRGIAGAESAVMEAITACARRGFPVGAAMCLHKGNKETLRSTVNLLASLGVSSLRAGSILPTPLWREHADGNDMDIREYYEAALEYIPFFYKDGMPMDVLIGAVVELRKGSTDYSCLPVHCSEPEKADKEFLCGAIRSCGYITPDG